MTSITTVTKFGYGRYAWLRESYAPLFWTTIIYTNRLDRDRHESYGVYRARARLLEEIVFCARAKTGGRGVASLARDAMRRQGETVEQDAAF
jgi:hypothetical protein